jgi:hypothetical protein
MTNVERAKFEKHLELLCAKYNLPFTPARKESYWRSLYGDLTLSAFIGAVDRFLATPGAFPGAEEIRLLGRELMGSTPPTLPPHIAERAEQSKFRAQRSDESAAQYATQLMLHERTQPRPLKGDVQTRMDWEREFSARFGPR